MKSHRHSKTLLVTLLMCLVLSAAFYPFRFPVQERIEGVLVSSVDESLCEPVTLTMEGSYSFRLLGTDELSCSYFSVSGAVTQDYLECIGSEGSSRTNMQLLAAAASGETTQISGLVRYSHLNAQAELCFPPVAGEETQRLVFPATSREDALRLLALYDADFYEATK